MIGLTVLVIAIGYVAFWSYLFKKVPTRRGKILTATVAVAIPCWDLPIGYVTFLKRCATEGGLHVNEKILPQKAVCVDTTFTYRPASLLNQGFEIVEHRTPKGVTQYRLSANGAIEQSATSSLVSLYCLSTTYGERLSWNTYRQDFVILGRTSGALAARYSAFQWRGGWWIPESLPGGGLYCSNLNQDAVIDLLKKGGG